MSLTSYRAAPSRGKPVALRSRTRYLAIGGWLGKPPGADNQQIFGRSGNLSGEGLGTGRRDERDTTAQVGFARRRGPAQRLGRGAGRGAPADRRAGRERRQRGARIPQGDETLAGDPAPLRAVAR